MNLGLGRVPFPPFWSSAILSSPGGGCPCSTSLRFDAGGLWVGDASTRDVVCSATLQRGYSSTAIHRCATLPGPTHPPTELRRLDWA